jgi:hypothetical protein
MCQLRIHLAAAILANDPPPGFAASLLNETTVPLQIWVLDQGFQRPISTQGGGVFHHSQTAGVLAGTFYLQC